MNYAVSQSFEAILIDFKNTLTPKECQDFQFATLRDVQETALRIQKDQENLRTVMGMHRLESFLEAMTQFGKVVEVFANSSIFVAFVWGPLKFILQTASTLTNTFELILDAYSQIGEHMPLLEQYKSLFGTNPSMTRVLAFIYSDILNFHKKAVRMLRGKSDVWKQVFRSVWKDFETQFKGILHDLTLHRQLIAEQAQILHFEQSWNSSQKVLAHIQQYEQDRLARLERLRKQENDEKYDKQLAVLNWFSAAQTASDHENFCRTRNSYVGSGDWILKHEKIQNWKEMDPPISSILWLNGIPGAGKTILSSVIIQSCLQKAASTTAYFYCLENDPRKNDCISIYRGLLSQLLQHCQDLIPFCYEKLSSHGELNLTSLALAEKLLKLFIEKIPKLFFIIDGLDECDTTQRTLVLTFLTSIVERWDDREPGKLCVLFISQDFPDIRKTLQTATVMDLTPEDNKNDIKAYVLHWSNKIQQKYEIDDKDIDFIKESTLVRSKGMFLYAKLVMENLYAQETRNNFLNEIGRYSFPAGLGDAYQRILIRLERSLEPTQWAIMRKLLGWMVCAKRPLKWREIQAAVSINPDEQSFDFDGRRLRSSVAEYCGSLIQVLSEDRVELVHTTAKIYIMESEFIRPLAVECDLAALCLRYLTFECFDDKISPDYLHDIIADGFISFQDYAAAKWHQHLRAIISTHSANLLTDSDSQGAFRDLGLGLEEFLSRYEQEVMEMPILEEAKADCEQFAPYRLHTNLVYVWNHVRQHDGNDETRNVISVKSLSDAVARNREALETFSLSEDVRIFYGSKLFKCPRTTCFYFHEGFEECSSRKKHISRHDRPFHCAFPDCSIAEFGFSSNTDLEKHRKLFHPDFADLTSSFSSYTKPTAGTRFLCELCGKHFTTAFHQRNHLRSHAGERPFKCSECGRAFTRKNDCKRHEKLHTRR